MFIDHIGITVSDIEKSKAFYTSVLGKLGYGVKLDLGDHFCFGYTDKDSSSMWVEKGTPTPYHIAFGAKTPDEVKAFYNAALELGGIDNGAPGPRPEYGPDYYGAFVIDPDGYKIEAAAHI
jgi:catechol 2,3-dioxygenase-like lactoylglutathione lyase family enzyme